MEETPTILVIVPDLLFQSRLREQAHALGYGIRSADTNEETDSALDDAVDLVVVDLHAEGIDWRNAVERAKACEIPVLAFGRHTAADLLRSAREAGCDEVVVRSVFVEEMPRLLRALIPIR